MIMWLRVCESCVFEVHIQMIVSVRLCLCVFPCCVINTHTHTQIHRYTHTKHKHTTFFDRGCFCFRKSPLRFCFLCFFVFFSKLVLDGVCVCVSLFVVV